MKIMHNESEWKFESISKAQRDEGKFFKYTSYLTSENLYHRYVNRWQLL